MERAFIFDKYNTYADWKLILTEKDTTPPDIKTKYIDIDGFNGSLDASESLTGEITFKDRKVSATFWTDEGNFKTRRARLNQITSLLHGRKVKIIEPDRPDRYYFGRCEITSIKEEPAYLTFKIEATCDPWSYKLEESVRIIPVAFPEEIDVVLYNYGRQTVCPNISVSGNITLDFDGVSTVLTDGNYKVSNIRLKTGSNVVTVSGNGSVMFTYREGDL